MLLSLNKLIIQVISLNTINQSIKINLKISIIPDKVNILFSMLYCY